MQCKRCGAELLDTDTFCVNCGQKVGEEARCPKCGELLREGTKFCHKCGTSVEDMIKLNSRKTAVTTDTEEIPLTQQKTMDIPFDLIEKSILLEAEQAIVKRDVDEKKERYINKNSANEDGYDAHNEDEYDNGEEYNDEEYDDEEYDDVDNDDEDEYDESDEYEDDEASYSLLSKLSKVIILAILLVVVIVVFNLWRESGGRIPSGSEGPASEETAESEEPDSAAVGRIQVIKGVNIRDKASTSDSNVIRVADTGETFDYIELIDDAWYHIVLEDGSTGYVYKEYVEELD